MTGRDNGPERQSTSRWWRPCARGLCCPHASATLPSASASSSTPEQAAGLARPVGQRRGPLQRGGRVRRWRRRRDQAILLQIVMAKEAAQTLIHLLVQPALFTPAGLAPRFCPNLQVGQPVERLATVYAEQGASKADLCGRAPASAAAAAIRVLLASQGLAGRGGAGRGSPGPGWQDSRVGRVGLVRVGARRGGSGRGRARQHVWRGAWAAGHWGGRSEAGWLGKVGWGGARPARVSCEAEWGGAGRGEFAWRRRGARQGWLDGSGVV